MPELPEVETMCRGVAGCVGGTILQVELGGKNYRPLPMSPSWPTIRRRLIGRSVVKAHRIGKRVLLDLDTSESLIFQPKMAGLLLVGQPPSDAHVRMRLFFKNGNVPEVIYWDRRGLGTIHLWSLEQIQEHLGPGKLGPDALEISESDFRKAFCECKREVKPALLDQSKVAGIGNLYASEILFQAKVHPERRCDEITRSQWSRIYLSSLEILHEAIRREGSTLGDGTYRNAQNNPGEYQHQHQVYARQDESCIRCKTPILRIVQSQRSTFYCPRCQK